MLTGLRMTPADDPDREREISRKRDELLAAAKRNVEGGPKESSGQGLAASGFQFVIIVLISLYGGLWLDRKLGSSPWGVLGGVLAGTTIGFIVLVRSARDAGKEMDDAGRKAREPKGENRR